MRVVCILTLPDAWGTTTRFLFFLCCFRCAVNSLRNFFSFSLNNNKGNSFHDFSSSIAWFGFVYKFFSCVYICCTMNYAPFLNGCTANPAVGNPSSEERESYSNPKKKRRRAKQERQSSSKTHSEWRRADENVLTLFFLSSPCWLCILFLYDTAAAAQERISQRTQDASLFYLFIFLVEPAQRWQKPWAQWTGGGEGHHKIIKSSCKVSPVLRNLWQKNKQQKNVKRVARKNEVKM